MTQAQIIVGESNSVRSYAFELAQGLNCIATSTDGVPCGKCISCRVFASGNHPDIIFVTGTKTSGIGVDDVRQQIVLPMATKPFKYKYKIFIIEKAETLTHAAQNALLKTIEEPAPYGVFLFIAANTNVILPTFISRCTVIRLSEESLPDHSLKAFAEEIADKLRTADIYDAFGLYRLFEPYKESKETLQEILSLLYIYCGEKITGAAKANIQPKKSWFDAANAISHAKRSLTKNGNTQLTIELMLVKLIGI